MRVIAGRHKGRRLIAPKGAKTRPTSDRVREALFSILGELGGERVLDLFAGSGALGIEALSRGASHGTFVDSDVAAVRAVRQNIARLGIGNATVMRAGVPVFKRPCARPISRTCAASGSDACSAKRPPARVCPPSCRPASSGSPR